MMSPAPKALREQFHLIPKIQKYPMKGWQKTYSIHAFLCLCWLHMSRAKTHHPQVLTDAPVHLC